MNTTEKQSSGLHRDIVVYLSLLALAALQIIQAYSASGEGRGLAARLLVVAMVQAFIAVLFFMHLKSARSSLVWFVTVFTLFALAAMQYGWTDSFRIIDGVPFAHLH